MDNTVNECNCSLQIVDCAVCDLPQEFCEIHSTDIAKITVSNLDIDDFYLCYKCVNITEDEFKPYKPPYSDYSKCVRPTTENNIYQLAYTVQEQFINM